MARDEPPAAGLMGIFPQNVALAFKGELEAYLKEADEVVLRASRLALVSVTESSKLRLRGQVSAAGLAKEGAGSGKGSGRSLASAIRVELYPKRGLARNPAGLIYIQPSAVKIYESFERGLTIRPGRGKFLTVPVPGSPADRKVGGDKPRGETLLASLKAKGIEFSFVPARNGRPAMLVAESVRVRTSASGRTKASRASRLKSGGFAKGAASVPLFFLVPRVKMPKKLSLNKEFERTADEFFRDFGREFDRIAQTISPAGRKRA